MSTALRGVPLVLTRAQCLAPGTAPSRLKAKSIRDVEVMHAVVQKICPAMLMKTTTLNRPEPRALKRTASAVPAPKGLTEVSVELMTSRFVAANTNDSRRTQPPIAE